MFGLKEMSALNVDHSSSNNVSTSQKQPKSFFFRLISRTNACWRAIAGISPSTSPVIYKAVTSKASQIPSACVTECTVQEAIDKAIAEEQSVMTALRTVGLYLTKTGFEPGRDFSITQGKLLLNAHAYDYLQQTIKSEHFADIVEFAPELLTCSNQSAMDALNQHLGVDFFENLREAMLVRLPSLSDGAMLGYASRLIQGMSHRHPEIKGFEQWVKQVVHEAIDAEHLRELQQRRTAHQLNIQADDGWVLLLDLLMAAGGKEDIHFQRTVDGVFATEEGKKLLSQLIAGPSISIQDLA